MIILEKQKDRYLVVKVKLSQNLEVWHQVLATHEIINLHNRKIRRVAHLMHQDLFHGQRQINVL